MNKLPFQDKRQWELACQTIRDCGYCQRKKMGLCIRHEGTV